MRPRVLDMYCGAGGCSRGYDLAGFDPYGVDNRPQPNYPYHFCQADSLMFLRNLIDGDNDACGVCLSDFAFIHASPPCQRFSRAQRLYGRDHPDLLTPTLELLQASGVPWVIENVPGAPLPNAVELCGSAFGLRLRRHRLFASSLPLVGSGCQHEWQTDYITPFGHGFGWVTIFGGGAAKNAKDGRRRANAQQGREAMGIDWMTRDELAQAIPPAYTEFVGKQLLNVLQEH